MIPSQKLTSYRFHVQKNLCEIKRLYCENLKKSPKNNDEPSNDKSIQKIKPEPSDAIVPRIEPTKMELYRNAIANQVSFILFYFFFLLLVFIYQKIIIQLAHLSPVSSRRGKMIWLLVIFSILIALWNADKIAGHFSHHHSTLIISLNIIDNQRRKRIMYYDRLFFQKDFTKLLGATTESIESKDFPEDHYFRGILDSLSSHFNLIFFSVSIHVKSFLGLAYFMLNNHEKALLDFKNVCERSDSHLAHVSSSLTYSCFSFIAFGKYHEALSVAEDSLNINPHSSVAYKYAFRTWEKKKNSVFFLFFIFLLIFLSEVRLRP